MTTNSGSSPRAGVALVGYRGTGKSTVGQILAQKLDRNFVDLDLEIERRAGRSIRNIFMDWGEPVFRDWEEKTLTELIASDPLAVMATGGGAVLRESNRRRIRAFGVVIWLTAEPAELARRLEADARAGADRPALTAAGTLAEIATLLESRRPVYEDMADAAIETGGKSPGQVADAICDYLLRASGAAPFAPW